MTKELTIEKTNLPNGWSIKVLADFTETINGIWTGKKEPYIPVKVYTMSNFTKGCDLNHSKKAREVIAREVIASVSQYEKRMLKYGDIIIEKSGGGPNQPVGRAVLFNIKNNEENTFSNFTTRLRICEKNKEDVNSNYLHKFLKLQYLTGVTEKFQKNSTNIRNLQLKEYLQLEIPLPTLTQQKQIVATLDQAFAAIDTVKANAQQNLQNAKELFESYLQNVFENKGDDWEEKTLGKLCERVSVGYVGPTSKFYCDPSIGIPFIRSQNVRSGYLDWKGIQHVTKEFHNSVKKSQLKINDILFVRVGAKRGDCCVLKENIEELNCANIVFARLTTGNVDFIDRFCQSSIGKKQLLGMSVGAAQSVINTKSVAGLIIPYPPIAIQQIIVQKANALSAECKKLEAIYTQKIADLEEMKKSVLQKAFSGQLNTKN